jgi:phytoene synthase
VCATLVERAQGHFAQADAIMARSPRKAVKAPRIMGEYYRLYLKGMVARGWAPQRERVRPSRAQIAWILLRYALV